MCHSLAERERERERERENVCARMCVCVHVCVCACVRACIIMCVHVRKCVHACMCVLHLCIECIYMCMCTHQPFANATHYSCFVIQQLPFFFPANLLVYFNGSSIPPDHNLTYHDNKLIIAVSGLIPEEEYQQMLREKHFNYTTPQEFHGFNVDPFPFWSSEPLTYASTMLALTQYRALLGGE